MYEVTYKKKAEQVLSKLPRNLAQRIRKKVDIIASNPYAQHNNVTKLRDRPGYRLRVGDWRIVYDINDGELIILVLKIAPRGKVYR